MPREQCDGRFFAHAMSERIAAKGIAMAEQNTRDHIVAPRE
jgi:hypothetical protein